MNCERVQEKVIEALASGESELRGRQRLHLQSCVGCRAFFADQTALFQAIDSRLRVIANEPVPPSLLPGLRVRLREDAPAHSLWIPVRQRFAIAAVVILAVVVSLPLRRTEPVAHSTAESPLVASGRSSEVPAKPSEAAVLATLPRRPHAASASRAGAAVPAPAPEVLVLGEEQEAFAHFVAGLFSDRDAAAALASAEPAKGDAPVEIALLTIESVEVKPLEGSSDE
jgi:hypothetical protein